MFRVELGLNYGWIYQTPLEMEHILSILCLPFSPSEQMLIGSKALLRENVGRAGDQNLLLLCCMRETRKKLTTLEENEMEPISFLVLL